MGLADLDLDDILTETVSLGKGKSFSVRGLNLTDFTALFHRHTNELTELFSKAAAMKAGGKSFSLEDSSAMVTGLIQQAPVIAAEVIALASGDINAWEIANRLPAPVQLDALSKVAGLTFTSEMPLKKALALVVEMAKGAQSALSDLQG